ncbi:Spo11/DNA topoisomerase VI subunit A [Suillus subalutaceus]|uniref:Spo11/DNA topoisomerase VI subunit A n=1 Tax=Suillus subalutaceus TaxID=48586 RepID=UPI001B860AD1|nr:Spo11/DNA topoisomerase VI subunit A [Suillus subalutaceus]KAG1861609.1 Spo11/DNA topoisomerase VI subunit A [Suillus subalutaceus]
MDLAHQALVDNVPLTKRYLSFVKPESGAKKKLTSVLSDMYYKDVPLFKSQGTVDRLIDDLAVTLGLERADLKIRAASKGLICGTGLTIHLLEGEVISINDLETTFRQHIPIVALVDGDAYGLDILSVYKYGSHSLRHENKKLAAKRIEWLGIWASEIADLEIDLDTLIPITLHDEKKALAVLSRPTDVVPTKWRQVKELTRMLHIRRKAEIEILSSSSSHKSNSLIHYLAHKIRYFIEMSA